MEKKTFKDADGTEHEVYEADQVETALKEKEEVFTTEKEKLVADLKEKEDALAKSNEKAGDFKALRDAKEVAEKSLKDASDKHAQEVATLKGSNIKEHKDKLFGLIVGNDKNVEEKMKFHLENTLKAMPETTSEEIDKKLKAAYTLVSGHADDERISNLASSAGGGGPSEKVDVNPDLKKIGKNFGLDDKDWENAKKSGVI